MRPPSASHPVSVDTLLGAVVAGKYRVTELMARGGMGRIYRAEQLPLGREVALKILTRPLLGTEADDEALEKRFLLEAATCARLAHPNTVSVYDYGSIGVAGDPTFYIVMELIRGRTLAQVLREEGPMPAARAARVVYEITRSLREAHRAGVVHRDLKPSNVMLVQTDEGESVKVLDFGVAKVLAAGTEALTSDGNFVGSPRYTAPEQIRQQAIDGRADLYALGVVLWELLTGAAPFSSPEPMRTLLMQLNDPPPPFDPKFPVPAGLEALCRQLLSKDAGSRPSDADVLMAQLRPFRAVSGADSTLEGPVPRDTVTQPTRTKNPVGGPLRWLGAAFGVAGLGVLGVVSLGAWYWWAHRAPPAVEVALVTETVAPPPTPAGPKLERLRIDSDPSGATLTVDGVSVGVAPATIEYDPSAKSVVIEATKPGYRRRELTVSGPDDDGVLLLDLVRVEPRPVPPSPPPKPPDGLRLER